MRHSLHGLGVEKVQGLPLPRLRPTLCHTALVCIRNTNEQELLDEMQPATLSFTALKLDRADTSTAILLACLKWRTNSRTPCTRYQATGRLLDRVSKIASASQLQPAPGCCGADLWRDPVQSRTRSSTKQMTPLVHVCGSVLLTTRLWQWAQSVGGTDDDCFNERLCSCHATKLLSNVL
jgi:hypothetical protein